MDFGRQAAPRAQAGPHWMETLEDIADRTLRKTKRFLPLIARLCFVSTYMEDSLRMFMQWSDQTSYMSRQLRAPYFIATILVAFNLFGQLGGSVLILARKYIRVACGILLGVVIAQTIEYQVYGDFHFLSRNFALLGGLILLLVESMPQATVSTSSLPSVGDDKPKNYLQLAGRVLVLPMFLSMVRFELTVAQLIYNFIGIPLMLLVFLGYKTKVSALLLVAICVFINIVYNSFWFVPSSQPLHDYLKYDFFQMCSIIGSLLFVVSLGAGGIALDDQKKRW